VRLGSENVMLAALFVGGWDGFEFAFDLGLVRGGGGSKTQDWGLCLKRRVKREHLDTDKTHDKTNTPDEAHDRHLLAYDE
jgi:hypothetical protein